MFNDLMRKRKFYGIPDMYGKEIKVGCIVLVHYSNEKIYQAIVIDVFPDKPTDSQAGYWVDIDVGYGVEEMMSYILEVI